MKESIILFLACICSHVYGKQIYKNNLHLNWGECNVISKLVHNKIQFFGLHIITNAMHV